MILMTEILLLLFMLALFPLMTGIVSYRAAEWCLDRQSGALRFLVWLALTAAAAGTLCGFLRLSGFLRLPDDNTWSLNDFDASWRDDGVRLLQIFTGPLGGCAAALVFDRKRGGFSRTSLWKKTEEKS